MIEIPQITHPLGKYWHQPDRSEIMIDEECAVMTVRTLNDLWEYSCTNPSFVYPGKMWRCKKNYYDESKGWLLKWFGPYEKGEDWVSNHCREILLIE